MRLEVRHLTRYRYSSPITETQTELRLRPLETPTQRLLSFDLQVHPAGPLRSYVDAFGNTVHKFNYVPEHQLLEIRSRSVVETAGPSSTLATEGGAGGPALPGRRPEGGSPPSKEGEAEAAMETPEDFVYFRPPVVDVPALRRFADRFRPSNGALAGAVERALDDLTTGIGRQVRYLPDSTTVSSAVDDVLRQRSGVCQDFAHLLIASARSWGVPARYVSGYVYTGSGEPVVGASHAWAEAWVPGEGWVGYDATHPVRVGDRHVRVAVGRDYRDAAPTRGVYVGVAQGDMEVSVEVTPV